MERERDIEYEAKFVEKGHVKEYTHCKNGAMTWTPTNSETQVIGDVKNDRLALREAQKLAEEKGLVLLELTKVTKETLFTAIPTVVTTKEVYE